MPRQGCRTVPGKSPPPQAQAQRNPRPLCPAFRDAACRGDPPQPSSRMAAAFSGEAVGSGLLRGPGRPARPIGWPGNMASPGCARLQTPDRRSGTSIAAASVPGPGPDTPPPRFWCGGPRTSRLGRKTALSVGHEPRCSCHGRCRGSACRLCPGLACRMAGAACRGRFHARRATGCLGPGPGPARQSGRAAPVRRDAGPGNRSRSEACA